MSKKLFTMFMLFATVFIFTGSSDLMGCHAYITGLYHDSSGNVHGFLATYYPNTNGTTFNATIDYPNATWTRGRGVNDDADIVGSYEDSNGDTHGFYKPYGQSCVTVDYANATYTEAKDINDAHKVVGYYIDSSGVAHGFIIDDITEATWSWDSIDHDDANCVHTKLLGMNETGDYVGNWEDASGNITSFKYDGTDFTDIEPQSVDNSWGIGINDSDDIVGDYLEGTTRKVFFYDSSDSPPSFTEIAVPETPTPIGNFLGSINNDGDIAGYYKDYYGDKWGFIYEGGTYVYPINYSLSGTTAIQTRIMDISREIN